jgi:NAD(P)H-hydrate epimerase
LFIGAGLGADPETEDKFLEFLSNYSLPLVLDADALNLISKNSENLNLIPKNQLLRLILKSFLDFLENPKILLSD